MNEVNITIAEVDVVIFPLEVFYRPLVQIVDISEWPLSRFPGIVVSSPMRLSSEMRSARDIPDFKRGLRLCPIIMRSRPPIIDVVSQVPAIYELIYLIL